MALKDSLAKGVTISGLTALMKDGADASSASWSISGNKITFSAGSAGANKVKILPFKPGDIAETNMEAMEVISGEFTGCIMGVYKKGASIYANHVATAKGAGDMKAEWEKVKKGVTVLNEFSTKDKVPDFLGVGKPTVLEKDIMALREKPEGRVCLLCVASPVPKYQITYAYVLFKNSEYQVLRAGSQG